MSILPDVMRWGGFGGGLGVVIGLLAGPAHWPMSIIGWALVGAVLGVAALFLVVFILLLSDDIDIG